MSRENNGYSRKSIAAEIRNFVRKIDDNIELYEGNTNDLVVYQKINTHFIFDITLGDNFRQKVRLVSDGHNTTTLR